jgi:hypothetical protein
MAMNLSRSMNQDLYMGQCDGKHKSLTPSRGGEVETDWPMERAMTMQRQYNFTDFRTGIKPDCGCGY